MSGGTDTKAQRLCVAFFIVGLFCGSFCFIAYYPESTSSIPDVSPVTGEQTLTVIPVLAADQNWTLPYENITKLVFDELNSYFQEQSYGAIWITGRISRIIHLTREMAYYARGLLNVGTPEQKENASFGANEFTNEVLAQLVWTPENITRHIFLMYAGSSSLHPHHNSREVYVDGVKKRVEYSVVPELYSLATMAHEFAHGLGLKDLYDLEFQRVNAPVGRYALMAYQGLGIYVNDMCGYSRYKLGWISGDKIEDVRTDSTRTIVDLNGRGPGIKLVRIILDEWNYLVIESRYKDEHNLGILITHVDLSRPEGGYGRLEVVRPFDAVPSFDLLYAVLNEGEQYVEPTFGISIRVLARSTGGYLVNFEFGIDTSISQQTIGLGGEITGLTSHTLSNGTTLVAATIFNSSSELNQISVYSLRGGSTPLLTSYLGYNCYNPVVVSYENEFGVVYELENRTRHSVVFLNSNGQMVISGTDDARLPTACRGNQRFCIAYENHTPEQTEIAVRYKSASNWNDNSLLFPLMSARVVPNENGTPHSPQLTVGNDDVSLAYVRSGSNGDMFELKYSIDSEPLYRYTRNKISRGSIFSETTFNFYISLVDESNSHSEVISLNGYSGKQETVADLPVRLLDVIGAVGVWSCQVSRHTVRLSRLWDSYKNSCGSIDVDLGLSTAQGMVLGSESGTPCILVFSTLGSSIEVRRVYISTISLNPASPVVYPLVISTVVFTLVNIIGCLVYFITKQKKGEKQDLLQASSSAMHE